MKARIDLRKFNYILIKTVLFFGLSGLFVLAFFLEPLVPDLDFVG